MREIKTSSMSHIPPSNYQFYGGDFVSSIII